MDGAAISWDILKNQYNNYMKIEDLPQEKFNQ